MNRIACCMALLAVLPIGAIPQQLPFGDVPQGVVKPSIGCAAAVHDEVSRRRCALRELRYVDARLNSRYQELRRQLRPDEMSGVLSTQREWVKQRDASCNLHTDARNREGWLNYIAQSDVRTKCVMMATEKRVAELERMQDQLAAPPVLAQVAPEDAEPASISSETAPVNSASGGYLMRSMRSHRSGKYYFEVVVDQARTRDKVEASLVARVNDGRRWVGTIYELRPRALVLHMGKDSSVRIEGGSLGDIRLPKVVIGIAVDLDAGRLYRHRDGIWLGGAVPGSPQGIALRQDAEFAAELSSSVRLEPLLENGVVKLNFGATRFERTPPAGYRGFDWQEDVTETTSPPAPLAIYSPGDQVAGEAQVQWVKRYWEWVKSFASNESPSADTSGYRCGAGQSGPVWYLTGSVKSGSIQRECEVPAGRILLVPIANTLGQANPGMQVGCDNLVVSLRQFSTSITDLRLKIDGVALDRPERFQLGTGCFNMRDGSTGQSGLAAGTGYWVFIKPLAKGRHELAFGGTFTVDNFRQDIRYVVHVR